MIKNQKYLHCTKIVISEREAHRGPACRSPRHVHQDEQNEDADISGRAFVPHRLLDARNAQGNQGGQARRRHVAAVLHRHRDQWLPLWLPLRGAGRIHFVTSVGGGAARIARELLAKVRDMTIRRWHVRWWGHWSEARGPHPPMSSSARERKRQREWEKGNN